MKVLKLIVLAAVALCLAACGTTIQQRAYTVGSAYSLVQQGAIKYMQLGKPSADIADKIADADARASSEVQSALQCAAELLAPTVPADAAMLGLDAGDVADAKTEACESALSRANEAVDTASAVLKGN